MLDNSWSKCKINKNAQLNLQYQPILEKNYTDVCMYDVYCQPIYNISQHFLLHS